MHSAATVARYAAVLWLVAIVGSHAHPDSDEETPRPALLPDEPPLSIEMPVLPSKPLAASSPSSPPHVRAMQTRRKLRRKIFAQQTGHENLSTDDICAPYLKLSINDIPRDEQVTWIKCNMADDSPVLKTAFPEVDVTGTDSVVPEELTAGKSHIDQISEDLKVRIKAAMEEMSSFQTQSAKLGGDARASQEQFKAHTEKVKEQVYKKAYEDRQQSTRQQELRKEIAADMDRIQANYQKYGNSTEYREEYYKWRIRWKDSFAVAYPGSKWAYEDPRVEALLKDDTKTLHEKTFGQFSYAVESGLRELGNDVTKQWIETTFSQEGADRYRLHIDQFPYRNGAHGYATSSELNRKPDIYTDGGYPMSPLPASAFAFAFDPTHAKNNEANMFSRNRTPLNVKTPRGHASLAARAHAFSDYHSSVWREHRATLDRKMKPILAHFDEQIRKDEQYHRDNPHVAMEQQHRFTMQYGPPHDWAEKSINDLEKYELKLDGFSEAIGKSNLIPHYKELLESGLPHVPEKLRQNMRNVLAATTNMKTLGEISRIMASDVPVAVNRYKDTLSRLQKDDYSTLDPAIAKEYNKDVRLQIKKIAHDSISHIYEAGGGDAAAHKTSLYQAALRFRAMSTQPRESSAIRHVRGRWPWQRGLVSAATSFINITAGRDLLVGAINSTVLGKCVTELFGPVKVYCPPFVDPLWLGLPMLPTSINISERIPVNCTLHLIAVHRKIGALDGYFQRVGDIFGVLFTNVPGLCSIGSLFGWCWKVTDIRNELIGEIIVCGLPELILLGFFILILAIIFPAFAMFLTQTGGIIGNYTRDKKATAMANDIEELKAMNSAK